MEGVMTRMPLTLPPAVHPARCAEVAGEHAHAVGAGARREGPVPRHRRHHIRERDPLGHRARVHRPVGHHVDHDAS